MAARLTRARKRLAGGASRCPTAPSSTRASPGRRRRLPGLHHRVRARLRRDVLRADLGRRGDPAGAGAARAAARPDAELDALLALMLLQHSRRDARVDEDGGLVLLPDQDRRRWHADEIDEAIALLTAAECDAPATPYLLQALIAAEHAIAATAADTDWSRIADRYGELEELTGSPVVRLNRAVAVAEADGPLAGLRLLEGLDLPGHRLPGVRGELLRPRPARSRRRAAARASRSPRQATRRARLPGAAPRPAVSRAGS